MIEDLLRLVDDPRTVAGLRRHDSVHHPRRRFEIVGDRDPPRVTAGDLVALTLVGVAVPPWVALDLPPRAPADAVLGAGADGMSAVVLTP